jgi:hypothetical protein
MRQLFARPVARISQMQLWAALDQSLCDPPRRVPSEWMSCRQPTHAVQAARDGGASGDRAGRAHVGTGEGVAAPGDLGAVRAHREGSGVRVSVYPCARCRSAKPPRRSADRRAGSGGYDETRALDSILHTLRSWKLRGGRPSCGSVPARDDEVCASRSYGSSDRVDEPEQKRRTQDAVWPGPEPDAQPSHELCPRQWIRRRRSRRR